jgi:hypothetical protein
MEVTKQRSKPIIFFFFLLPWGGPPHGGWPTP